MNEIRRDILRMTYKSKSSHVGSCLSVVEILYVLYFKVMNIDPDYPKLKERDKLILSKGHASAALYATLAERGYFSKDILDKFYVDNGILPGHLDMEAVPGVEASTGSLGHGLSLGIGMAIANKQTGNPGRIFVILGDGECNEGSVWEAAMLGAFLCLSNLTVIIDFNKLQGFGRINEIIDQTNLSERWKVFGWEVFEVDGHSLEDLENVLTIPVTKPKAIIAHTIKGKGVSFMEDKLEWHYKSPDDAQYAAGIKELESDR